MFHGNEVRRDLGLSRRGMVRLVAVLVTVVALLALQMGVVGAETVDSTVTPTLDTVPPCVQVTCGGPLLTSDVTIVILPPTLGDPPVPEPTTTTTVAESTSTTTTTVAESTTTTTTTVPESTSTTTTTTTVPESTTTSTTAVAESATTEVVDTTSAPPASAVTPLDPPTAPGPPASVAAPTFTTHPTPVPTESDGSPSTSDAKVDTGSASGARLGHAGADGNGIPLAPVDPAVVAVPLFTD